MSLGCHVSVRMRSHFGLHHLKTQRELDNLKGGQLKRPSWKGGYGCVIICVERGLAPSECLSYKPTVLSHLGYSAQGNLIESQYEVIWRDVNDETHIFMWKCQFQQFFWAGPISTLSASSETESRWLGHSYVKLHSRLQHDTGDCNGEGRLRYEVRDIIYRYMLWYEGVIIW